ncbi:MAG: hypothetical protein RMK35_03895 [Aquificaceae bacterium]|nr:hypothetical protein [Aquificaceae bacterium]
MRKFYLSKMSMYGLSLNQLGGLSFNIYRHAPPLDLTKLYTSSAKFLFPTP